VCAYSGNRTRGPYYFGPRRGKAKKKGAIKHIAPRALLVVRCFHWASVHRRMPA